MHSVAYTINPALYANAGYDPLKDFVPLILAASTPNAFSVHPSVPAKNLQELIKLSRQHPLAYGSPGIGTSPHLSMERIKTIAKIDITHVPYQPAQAVTALIGGQTPVLSISVSIQLPHIKAGKIRALAVTSAQRAPTLPDVPTVAEQGFKGYEELNWFGIFAPAAVPAGIAGRLNAEMNRVLELPDIRDKLGQLGLDFRRNSLAEFAAFIKDEVPKQAKAVKDSGAKVEEVDDPRAGVWTWTLEPDESRLLGFAYSVYRTRMRARRAFSPLQLTKPWQTCLAASPSGRSNTFSTNLAPPAS
jgi:tripartite-type tricarboxylate transporter receptor subunit TctC